MCNCTSEVWFDGASISASVGETPQGVTNKSLTAGFKRGW
jgi:hypothetical protein